MRMGSEKSPPDDDSVGGVGRSFLEGGGPNKLEPGFVDVCLVSSECRRAGFDGPDLEPAMCVYIAFTATATRSVSLGF